jgi:hypothetical protein
MVFFVTPITSFAQEDEKSLEELKQMREELKSNIEKLQEEVQINEELEEKVNEKKTDSDNESQEEFEDKIEELSEDIEDARKSFNEEVEELHEDIEDMEENIKEELEEIERKSEEDSHAGSFVFCPRLAWLDKDPLKLLQKSDSNLQGKTFDFHNNESFMIGFMNYYSIENNFRIGTDIAGGYKQFDCTPFRSILVDTAYNDTGAIDTITQLPVDSIITLHVIPAHIGFICEKVFHFVKWDVFTGFMIGGGALVVIKNSNKVSNIFIGDNDSDTTKNNSVSAVVAPSFIWDIHAGTAVEIAPNFHFGVDCILDFSYAHNGFNGRTKDFVSINPAIRLRLSVGGAG